MRIQAIFRSGCTFETSSMRHQCCSTLSPVAPLLQVSNRSFKHTAVEVSERNILALLHELRTGYMPNEADLKGGCVHRARPARGPTTAEVRSFRHKDDFLVRLNTQFCKADDSLCLHNKRQVRATACYPCVEKKTLCTSLAIIHVIYM